MDTKQEYHKYEAADMPEIRKIRSKLIESYKLKQKYESNRAEVISKAMMKDIDCKKLGISDKNSYSTKLINEAIEAWRHSLKDMIDKLLFDESFLLYTWEQTYASSQEIFKAAETMAQKYFQRSSKPKRRQRRKKTSLSTTRTPQSPSLDQSTPPPPTTRTSPSRSLDQGTPPPLTTSTPPSPTSNHHQQLGHLHLDLPLDWSKPVTSTDWSKSRQMNEPKTSPKVNAAPRRTPPKPHEQTPSTITYTKKTQRNTHRLSNPTVQSTIKSHFQTTKSSKPKHQLNQGPLNTKPAFRF